MPSYSISGGGSTTYTDTTPGGGVVIDFASLDNSFSVQINGVELFIGGPTGAPNELEFQRDGTDGRTVRFADGDQYDDDTQAIWRMENTNGEPVVRLIINPDGTIQLYGVKVNNGPLEPLELYNGMTVNTAAVAAAWNDTGTNTITVDQKLTGPTNASGEINDIACFASGTLIETVSGPVRVEDLKQGDQVVTYDNETKPIRWIGVRFLSHNELEANPNLKPILIRADALGAGYPSSDLTVSPQHRILVSSAIAQRMFGRRDVLVPAKKLLPLRGIDVVNDTPDGIGYWHILLDDHDIVWSNGTPTESLYAGPRALEAITPEGRAEIEALFPELSDPDFEPQTDHFIPEKGQAVRKLVWRHQTNNKPLR